MRDVEVNVNGFKEFGLDSTISLSNYLEMEVGIYVQNVYQYFHLEKKGQTYISR